MLFCLGNQVAAEMMSCKKKKKKTKQKNSSNEEYWKTMSVDSELKQSMYAKFCTTWSLTLPTLHLLWIWSIKWKKNGNVTTMICYSSWIINTIIYHSDISGLQINSHGESEVSDQSKFIIWTDARVW